jgi:hypothetical protein
MLVRPISMHRRGDDIEFQLTGSLRLNRALARELAYPFGVALDEQTFVALTNDNGSFRPNGALVCATVRHYENSALSFGAGLTKNSDTRMFLRQGGTDISSPAARIERRHESMVHSVPRRIEALFAAFYDLVPTPKEPD